jgi:hypothetical protein
MWMSESLSLGGVRVRDSYVTESADGAGGRAGGVGGQLATIGWRWAVWAGTLGDQPLTSCMDLDHLLRV